MAIGDETIGLGATITIDDGGDGGETGGTAVAVDMLTSITPPSIKTGNTESKRLSLTRVRKIATVEDGGSWSFKQQHTHANWARMEAIRSNKRRNTFVITIPDDDGDTEITVVCLIEENKKDAVESDKIVEFETMLVVAE